MKNKLVWKLLGAFVPLILVAVIVLNFFVSFNLRNQFEKKITERLHSNSLLVGSILREDILKSNAQKIQEQVKYLGNLLAVRVTVVDEKGRVLGDSQEDPLKMENHGDRSEIIEALKKGRGESKRFSNTLNYNMDYLAVAVYQENKPVGVIRLAMALTDVDVQIRVIYKAVLWGGMIAAMLMIVMGFFISRSITNPISEMRAIAEQISNGDFSKKMSVRSQDELGSLAQSLNKMSRELQNQIESLKKMDKIRTDFVANVSHELKTPLTSIKGYVETLQDGAMEDVDNSNKFLGIIKKNADYLTSMVEDLLSLAEIERGEDEIVLSKFNLKELLSEIFTSFEKRLKKKNIESFMHVEGSDFQIHADKGKIQQVFVNIIDNALKYTKEKGSVNISVVRKDTKIVVKFCDTGIGIASQDVDRVFERFYRVDKAHSREIGGTGLGLSIVKHIVSMHKGQVSIDSAIGVGTTVIVELPVSEA